jgi:hypothetical protein
MRIRKLALLAAALSVPLATPVLAADAVLEQPPSRRLPNFCRRPLSGQAVTSVAMASTNGVSSTLLPVQMPMDLAAVFTAATTGSRTTLYMVWKAMWATPAPMQVSAL